MAIENDAAAAEAEFAASLADLEADQGDDVAEEAAPEADASEGDPEADEASEETEEEADELEEAPDTGGETLKAELAELLDSGDLKGLAEKLGLDPKIFKLNNKQFRAARVTERNARAAKADADKALGEAREKATKAEQLQAQAEQHYGPIAAGSMAYRQGDHMQVRAAIELMCQDTFQNVVANCARAAKGLDPGQVEVLKLRREIADRDRQATEAAAAAAAATEESGQVAKIAGALQKTPLAAVPGAEREIWELIKASKHPTLNKYNLSLKEAYQQVKAEHAKRAAAFGVRPKTGKTAPARQTIAKTPVRQPLSKKLTPEQEFAAELAAATKDTEAQARKIRRIK